MGALLLCRREAAGNLDIGSVSILTMITIRGIWRGENALLRRVHRAENEAWAAV